MTLQRRHVLAGIGAALGAGVLGGRALAMEPPPAAAWLPHGQFTQGGWARGQAALRGARLALDGASLALDADGQFLIAFDRDAPAQATLTGTTPEGGRLAALNLTIAPRAWEIEHIDTPRLPEAVPSADFQRLRAAELAQINVARAEASGSEGWRQNFVWPVIARISGRFGAQRIYRGGEAGAYHSGVDIAGGMGSPIRAPADGVVILAADHPFTLEGRLLMVDHGMGLNSAFLHCSEHLVRLGDRVAQGQPIARIGMTGRATGPHLHWSLKWREARLDPMLFAGPMPQA